MCRVSADLSDVFPGASEMARTMRAHDWASTPLGDPRTYGLDAAASDRAVIFSGDSPNDEPMFAAFALSVGVANVRNMLHRIARPPTYVTRGHSGDGFAELAERILNLRQQARASADA